MDKKSVSKTNFLLISISLIILISFFIILSFTAGTESTPLSKIENFGEDPQYFFIGAGGTGTGINESLGNTKGNIEVVWQSGGTGNSITFIKQYLVETTITTDTAYIGIWCNKSGVAGGDSVKLSYGLYDCGTYSDCVDISAGTLCSGTGSFDCDSTSITYVEVSCVPVQTIIETDNYLGLRFTSAENKAAAQNRLYYNGSSRNSYINLTEITADTEYPQFSDYWDTNGTLTNSGIGLFNVTVTSTNGTVLLEIDNTNITAINLTTTVYNVSYEFTSEGTYTYRWHSWSNGTEGNYNKSIDRSYTVNTSVSVEVVYPKNKTYYENITELRYTFTGGVDCWYSRDGGETNSSIVSCGTNFTDVISVNGSNTWTLYGNSTTSEQDSDSIAFTRYIESLLNIQNTTFFSDTSNSTIWVDNIFLDQVKVESEWTEFYNLRYSGIFNNTNVTYNAFAHFYNLTNALIYLNNSSVGCLDVPNCNENVNITILPNDYFYVLNNYVLIEGYVREYSPLYFSSSTTTKKGINSSLIDTINATVMVYTNGTTPENPKYTSNDSTFTKTYSSSEYIYDSTANTLKLNISGIEPAVSSNELSLDGLAPRISYEEETREDYSNVTVNWIYVNVSITEDNFKNMSFVLWNETDTVNETIFTSVTYDINWTNLPSVNYSYNVSIYDTTENFNSTATRHINLLQAQCTSLAIGLSTELSSGVIFDVTDLPSINLSADGNNGTGITLYNISIDTNPTETCKVDVYIKADDDLIVGSNSIPLANEMIVYNVTNSSVLGTKNSLTQSYSDNPIGLELSNGDNIFLKFYLNVSSSQVAGDYKNSVYIKGLENGLTP